MDWGSLPAVKPAVFAVLGAWLAAAPAEAQEGARLMFVRPAGAGAEGEAWRAALGARLAGAQAPESLELWATDLAGDAGAIRAERVEALAAVEALLVEARREAAALREGAALSRLAQAERIAEAHADLPGAARWIAEVETAIGIVAAQAGMDALAESALARAATLDPSRGIRAAEAPPDVVARAERIARAVATGPEGSFEVAASSPIARVWLDDVDLGAAPRVVRAPVGRHVLRIEAPGYLAFGRVIDVIEGERPAVPVRLAPDPIVRAARVLEEAVGGADYAAVPGAIAGLAAAGADVASVIVLEIGEGPRERALLVECAAQCDVSRVEREEDGVQLARADASLAGSRVWLRDPLPGPIVPPPGPAWWERWYFWAGVGAILIAGGTGAALLLRSDPERQREAEILPPVPGE